MKQFSIMKHGLATAALTLALLAMVPVARAEDSVPVLVRKLKKREGFFTRMNRKRRAMLGSIVSSMRII